MKDPAHRESRDGLRKDEEGRAGGPKRNGDDSLVGVVSLRLQAAKLLIRQFPHIPSPRSS